MIKPLIAMEEYRSKRDRILGTCNIPGLGWMNDQQKDALLDELHQNTHNIVAHMRTDEQKTPPAYHFLLGACLSSFSTWQLTSHDSELNLLDRCLCGLNALIVCGSLVYTAADVCQKCTRRRYEYELKTVQDLVLERDTLLHQD